MQQNIQRSEFEVDGLVGRYHHHIKFPVSKPDEPQPSLVILHGPNGVGKTTVLRMIDGLMRLDFDPFRENPFKTKDRVGLDFDAYLQSLLQGANISLKKLGEVKDNYQTLLETTKGVDDRDLLHGKDCVAVLCVLLMTDEFKETAVKPSCWASLDRDVLKDFPNLNAAFGYILPQKDKGAWKPSTAKSRMSSTRRGATSSAAAGSSPRGIYARP